MKSDFEKWADSFYDDRFKSPNVIENILFMIEDGSKYGAETGVWKCQESYFVPRKSSIFYTTPVYRVWILGKDILATTISLIIKELGRKTIRLLLLMWVAIQSSFTYRRFEK